MKLAQILLTNNFRFWNVCGVRSVCVCVCVLFALLSSACVRNVCISRPQPRVEYVWFSGVIIELFQYGIFSYSISPNGTVGIRTTDFDRHFQALWLEIRILCVCFCFFLSLCFMVHSIKFMSFQFTLENNGTFWQWSGIFFFCRQTQEA